MDNWPKGWGALKLLETLNFLKDPGPNWASLSARFEHDPKTIQKRIWETLNLIDRALSEVFFLLFFCVSPSDFLTLF